MQVEVSVMDGKGGLTLTGQVAERSDAGIGAGALTYTRFPRREFGLGGLDFDKVDCTSTCPRAVYRRMAQCRGHHVAALISPGVEWPVPYAMT